MIKNIVICFSVVLVFLGGAYFYSFHEQAKLYADDHVKLEYKACSLDNDCTKVDTTCSGSCGGSINRKHALDHELERQAICENYSGPVVDVRCISTIQVCNQGLCESQLLNSLNKAM